MRHEKASPLYFASTLQLCSDLNDPAKVQHWLPRVVFYKMFMHSAIERQHPILFYFAHTKAKQFNSHQIYTITISPLKLCRWRWSSCLEGIHAFLCFSLKRKIISSLWNANHTLEMGNAMNIEGHRGGDWSWSCIANLYELVFNLTKIIILFLHGIHWCVHTKPYTKLS